MPIKESCLTGGVGCHTCCTNVRGSCSLQHSATLCNTLQHSATLCNTLQHTATHCNTLQHTATQCNRWSWRHMCCTNFKVTAQCNTLKHSATRCNTLYYTTKDGATGVVGVTLLHQPSKQLLTPSHCIALHHNALHCITHTYDKCS